MGVQRFRVVVRGGVPELVSMSASQLGYSCMDTVTDTLSSPRLQERK